MLWRREYETGFVPVEEIELPLGLPEDGAFVMGPLSKWSDMVIWERLIGVPVWFGVKADAAMAQAVIPPSKLERVLLMSDAGDEVVAVAVREGLAVLAFKGKATESALDLFLEAMR